MERTIENLNPFPPGTAQASTVEEFTITGCARCGKTHPVTFRPLTNPALIYDPVAAYKYRINKAIGIFQKVYISKWGICPESGEPILMNVKPS